MAIGRRDFLRTAGLGAGAAAFGAATLASARRSLAQALPKPTGRRLVVIGGGFGGVVAARTVKKLVPEAEVLILERSPFFLSCPATLEYIFGLNSLDNITFAYTPLLGHGIRVLRSEVHAIEPDKKRVVAGAFGVEYDYLLLATGIRLAYEDIPGLPEAEAINVSIYDKGSPVIDARRRIEAFAGGSVVINAPGAPYKCPPGPYEHALLWADHIKRRKLKANVVFIDAKPAPIPPPNAPAFLEAMATHKDILEYRPQTKITGVDAAARLVKTDAGDVKFDFLSLIPPNKAAGLIKEAGLGSLFAEVDPVSFRSTKNESVYAVGDAAATVYTKSAYTAAVTGKIVGTHIAKAMGSKEPDPAPPYNICYPYVAADKAILIRADWGYETKEGKLEVTSKFTADNVAKTGFVEIRKEWEKGLWRDMFGK